VRDPACDHYADLHQAFAERVAGETGWLAQLRRDALGSFQAQGFPTTRMEDWRQTNLAPLARVPFQLASAHAGVIAPEDVEAQAVPLFACSLFVFVDGRFDPELSARMALHGEVHVESLAHVLAEDPQALKLHLGRLADAKRHFFTALNTAFLDDGAVLRLPPGTRLDSPLHVVFVDSGRAPATLSHPRLLVVAGAGSHATVIQDHVSLGRSGGFTNTVTEVFVGEAASLELVVLQRESPEQTHIANLTAKLERDARFTSHVVTLGGALVRNDLNVVLADEGAEATANGLFVATGEQRVDNHTTLDHAMPHGTSRELYKGILGGSSRGVFRGRVIVRPDAQHTRAEQSNPTLLISDAAQINSVPQLEIHADDVKCSHGAAIGRLDKDALFYLRSRGIGEDRARQMLARGFASEVIRAISVEPLRDEIHLLVAEALESNAQQEDAA
jgi:Fe-S cluster assembly protein SufD